MKTNNVELEFLWVILAVVLGAYVFVFGFLKKLNEWYYVKKLGKNQNSLPPGDMGWPFIGNTLSFVRAYKSQDPGSFINNLVKRYGETGIYKISLLRNPSIVVCSPELCRKVLTDDEQFGSGYPTPSLILGGKQLDYLSGSGPKQFRRLTTIHINGHEALSTFIQSIEEIVISTLEEWTRKNQPIEFYTGMNNIAFRVIMAVFLGSAADASVIASMEKYYTCLFAGLFCTAVNIPGFAYRRALKARKMLVKIIQAVLAERKERESSDPNTKRGVIDLIKEVENEQGKKSDDENIILVLLVFLLAGRETTGRAATWTTVYLYNHPEVLQKAKEEQEEIIRRRPSSQKGLTLNEIKQMKYLSKVIDETLRLRTNTFALFREAKKDTYLNGYFIPKGWKVLVWQSAVHTDTKNYSNPKEFLPSRWDDLKTKAGIFQPFGAGSRSCPGADLAKLEISIFLHHFLLNYKLEQVNPGGPVNYLPSPELADKCLAKIITLR